ncbi:MAG: hypothetical protein OEO77_10105 [Acidimicrobiia bacterium]|nr:hypothetical protein [Acidimicrobiia bacterium]
MKVPLVFALVFLQACAAEPIATSLAADVPVAPVGTQVELLTGPMSGMEALGTFVLEYDASLNCVYFVEEDNNGEPGTGGRVVIVWPPGYTAIAIGDKVSVFDAAGALAARTGVPFEMAGGGGPYNGVYCDAIGAWHPSTGPRPVDG